MTPYDELALAEAVAEGAAFMDAIDANVTDDDERWFWVVEPERLNLASGCWCVLGQHDPGQDFMPVHYGVHLFDAERFGFLLPDDGPISGRQQAWDALTALWVEEINERRAAWFDAHPEAVLA